MGVDYSVTLDALLVLMPFFGVGLFVSFEFFSFSELSGLSDFRKMFVMVVFHESM